MLDRVVDSLTQSSNLENMAGPIAESGEARWTVEEAKKRGFRQKLLKAH